MSERPPTVLAFDTSAPHVAVAICRGDQVLAEVHRDMARGQAEQLFPQIEQALQAAALTFGQVDRIGVGTGPGNFTGTRIAVSAARGLALGLDIPAIGVSTLEAQAFGQSGTVVSILPAIRGSHYVQVLQDGTPGPLLTCPPDPWPTSYGAAGLAVIGHLAGTAPDLPADRITAPALPLAIAIARIAATRAPDTRPVPLYARPADAAPPSDAPPAIVP
jgi:tRNA threonylcarbamoyl adenosine modification protein YeaZ